MPPSWKCEASWRLEVVSSTYGEIILDRIKFLWREIVRKWNWDTWILFWCQPFDDERANSGRMAIKPEFFLHPFSTACIVMKSFYLLGFKLLEHSRHFCVSNNQKMNNFYYQIKKRTHAGFFRRKICILNVLMCAATPPKAHSQPGKPLCMRYIAIFYMKATCGSNKICTDYI